jgi:dedicator of cytokinesis protein 3
MSTSKPSPINTLVVPSRSAPSDVNSFSSSRSILRGYYPNGTAEVWTEKTYYTTEQLFPTVLRRSEVIDIQPVMLSPIDVALNEVEEKTKQLSQMHTKFDILSKIDAVSSTNALSMALNEVVDVGQNTGVSLYRDIFLTTDYVQRHPAQGEAILKLRQAIDQLVRYT